jgi:hypothetical protein
MAKAKKQFAQGDVLFTKVAPHTQSYKKAKPQPILEGEFSGHIHTAHGDVKFVPANEVGLELGTLMVGPKGGEIRHEVQGRLTGDHDSFKLPSGEFRVTRQREHRLEKEEFVVD